MLDYSQVRDEAARQARKAKREGKRPLHIRGFDPAHPLEFCKRIPFLGDYVPEGWEVADGIQDLFVDSTGLGGEGEPALSVRRFAERLEAFRKSGDPYGFGISEAGEFQVYIRVYRPDRRDFTHTGALTNEDLARVRAK